MEYTSEVEKFGDQVGDSPVIDVSFEEVNQAVALIEQFEILQENLSGFFDSLPTQYQNEASTHLNTLETLLSILDSDLADEFDSLSNSKLSGRLPKSSIERLGISQELIRLRKKGKTISELANSFKIAPKTISNFFKSYDKMKPSDKAKVQKRSVFDTVHELEELAVLIKRNIARLEGQDDEVNVRLIGELRQTIIAASTLAEKMANHEQYQKFTDLVIRVLVDELPGKRKEILTKVQSLQGRTNNKLIGTS